MSAPNFGGVSAPNFRGGVCSKFWGGVCSKFWGGVCSKFSGGVSAPNFWGGCLQFSEYGQCSAGTHPTGMHSCNQCELIDECFHILQLVIPITFVSVGQ